jgi:hypothetical protein
MFGISFKIDGIGYVRGKAEDVHAAKSAAGRAFHQPYVRSVCVFAEDGQSHLYLKKDETGRVVKREEL